MIYLSLFLLYIEGSRTYKLKDGKLAKINDRQSFEASGLSSLFLGSAFLYLGKLLAYLKRKYTV